MRFVVTGDRGFIGTHLSNELESQGYEVHGFDKATGDLRVPGVFRTQLETVLSDHGNVDYVVHLAAKVGRLFGEDNVSETITDNAGMTALVAQACGELGVKLAYASTSEVYGDQGDTWCAEDLPMVLPHNVYGLSKRWGEEVCELYAPRGLVCFRSSMPYGPGLPAGRGRAAMINFLNQAMSNRPIPVHRGAERSWCWIGDTVRGARMILEHQLALNASTTHYEGKSPAPPSVWNVGRDDIAIPMKTVAEMACVMAGADLSLIQEVDPPERQTVVKRLSMSKLRSIGWEPHVELGQGMHQTYQWMKKGFQPLRSVA